MVDAIVNVPHAASAIVCGAPTFASGVTLDPFCSTIVGSEIFYQCQPGLLQEGRRALLCGGDGRWNPDPRDLCTGKMANLIMCQSTSILMYFHSRQKSVYGCYCSHYSCCLLTGDVHYWDYVWCFAYCLHQQVEQEGT